MNGDPRDLQLALALLRAWVAEDQEAIGLLSEEEITGDTFAAVLLVAAGALEAAHGKSKALQLIDGWFSLALAEASS